MEKRWRNREEERSGEKRGKISREFKGIHFKWEKIAFFNVVWMKKYEKFRWYWKLWKIHRPLSSWDAYWNFLLKYIFGLKFQKKLWKKTLFSEKFHLFANYEPEEDFSYFLFFDSLSNIEHLLRNTPAIIKYEE